VIFSPNGKLIATGSQDETARIINLDGKTLRTIQHSGTVLSVSFSPDGKLLASGSFDRTVKITNVSTGRTVRTIK